jgi:PPM family protein phosphatase
MITPISISWQLAPPLALSEVGGRTANEDTVYPLVGHATPADQLFVVCDGMGGLAKGEEASQLVSEAIVQFFQTWFGPSDADTIGRAVAGAEAAIDSYLRQYPAAKGMGTTLTLLHLHEQGATVAHIGDSRVYQFRDGAVLFQTDDHKLVNEWVRRGLLTPEQAAVHPNRNVVTRAIQGRSVQTATPDVHVLTDLRAGDYLLLCSDGLLEPLTDADLCAIMAEPGSPATKRDALHRACEGNTSDNYSAYLLYLQPVTDSL